MELTRAELKHIVTELIAQEIQVGKRQITKYGVAYDGLVPVCQVKGTTVMPVLNLDEIYELYGTKKVELSELAKDTVSRLKRDFKPIQLDWVRDWAKVKNHLILSACSTSRQDFLKNLVHERIGDIAIVPKILVSPLHQEPYVTSPIPKEMLNIYGISQESLMTQAKESSLKLLPPCAHVLTDMLKQMGIPLEEETSGELAGRKLYIMTNEYKWNGAATLFYPGVMASLHELLGDYYIIPSSIHELLIKKRMYKDEAFFEPEAKRTIKEVNRTNVKPEERLSDSLYIYDSCGLHQTE